MRRRSLVPFPGGRLFRASRYGLGRRVGCCGQRSSVDRCSRRGRRGRGTGCDRGDRRGARRIHIGHEGGEEAISKRGGVGSLKRQAVCQAKNVARAVQKRNEGTRTGYTHGRIEGPSLHGQGTIAHLSSARRNCQGKRAGTPFSCRYCTKVRQRFTASQRNCDSKA